MALDGGELAVRVTGDTSRLTNDIADAGDRAGSSFASKFARVSAVVGLGAAVGGALMSGFSTAINAETAQMKFTQLFQGDAEKAKAYIGDLRDFAAKTPFDFPGIQEAAGRFLAVGIEADRVIPIMTTLGDATALMGTGAEGVDRATTALTQMSQKGKVTGEEMLQLTEAGIPAWDALAASMGKPVPEVQDLVSKGLVPADAMFQALETSSGDALSTMEGGMVKMSETTQGKLSTLKDNFDTLMGKIADGLIPVFSKFVDFLIEDLIPAVDDMWTKFKEAWGWIEDHKTIFEVVTGIILTILIPAFVAMGIEAMKSAAKAVASWALQAGGAIVNSVIILANLTMLGIGYMKQAAQAMIAAGRVIVSWIIQRAPMLVTLGIHIMVVAVMIAQWVRMAVQSMIQAGRVVIAWVIQKAPMMVTLALMIVTVVVMIAQWVMLAVASLAQAALVALAWIIAFWPVVLAIAIIIAIIVVVWLFWDEIKAALGMAWDWIKQVFGWIGDLIAGVWNWIKETAAAVWEWVVEKVKWVWDRYVAIFTAIWDFIKGVFTSIKDFIVGVWDWVIDKVTAVKDWIVAKFQSVWDKVKEVFGNIKDKVKEVIDGIIQFVGELPGKIIGFFSDAASWLFNAGKDVVQGLIDGVKSLAGKIGNAFLDMLPGWIKGPFKKALGIGSPSKVFKGYGEDIGDGLLIGLDSKGRLVAMAATALADSATPNAHDIDMGLSGVLPSQRELSASYTVGGEIAPPQVRVFIGDKELTDIVKVEVRRAGRDTAESMLAGVRL